MTLTDEQYRAERALWLVQRLTRTDRPNRVGFDGMFECDYMGSSEFEFGALPASLKRMRAAKDPGLSKVVLGDRMVYLYGDKADRERVIEALPVWVIRGAHGKENSHFLNILTGKDWAGRVLSDWQKRTNAWWSISEGTDVLFTLDPDIAEAFADALTR